MVSIVLLAEQISKEFEFDLREHLIVFKRDLAMEHCKLVCNFCKTNTPLYKNIRNNWYHDPTCHGNTRCDANNIRRQYRDGLK